MTLRHSGSRVAFAAITELTRVACLKVGITSWILRSSNPTLAFAVETVGACVTSRILRSGLE